MGNSKSTIANKENTITNSDNKNVNSKHENEWETIQYMKDIIFNLNNENIVQSAESIINKFDKIYPISFNLIVTKIIYVIMVMRMDEIDLYLNFIKEIQKLEMGFSTKIDIFDIYVHDLLGERTQESYYLLTKIIESDLLDQKIIQNTTNSYFMQYMSDKNIKKLKKSYWNYVAKHYEELSNNNCELHKKLIKAGVNPKKIAEIIRNDDIQKLQEISSQTNFDFNQKIKPSLYERCSFINRYNVTLIDYAAFFSSVKCFKFLLMNGANIENSGKYAVAGGNEEIIHLCEQNHSSFYEACATAIQLHKNDIFHYIYENKLEKNLLKN